MDRQKIQRNKSTESDNPLVDIIGVVAVFSAFFYILDAFSRKTNTSIISNNARKVLDNKDDALKLREAVDMYHATGDWNKTKIKEIL